MVLQVDLVEMDVELETFLCETGRGNLHNDNDDNDNDKEFGEMPAK